MKSFFSISFAILFFLGSLFPKTDMEELFKVPILLKHYLIKHSDTNFFVFLSIHYSQANQNTDIEHEKLPLQSHCPEYCYCFLVFIIPNYTAYYDVQTINFSLDFESLWFDYYHFNPETHLLKPPLFA